MPIIWSPDISKQCFSTKLLPGGLYFSRPHSSLYCWKIGGCFSSCRLEAGGCISIYPNRNILGLSHISRNTLRLLKFSSRLPSIHHENYFHGKPGKSVCLVNMQMKPLWVERGGARHERHLALGLLMRPEQALMRCWADQKLHDHIRMALSQS